MNEKSSKPKILIVDDEPENIRILSIILRPKYRIMAATNGAEALELALSQKKPDLIFLDIMMPGMDGYEVCRCLKNHPDTKSIPVIFTTALNSAEDEIKGLAAGAADYITKPFHGDIILARAGTHIELKLHRDHLEELARERADQLIHSERLATLGTLSAGIIHEMSNQVHLLLLSIELLQVKFNNLLPFMEIETENMKENSGTMTSLNDFQGLLKKILLAGKRATSILDNMKKFVRRDDKKKVPVSVGTCVENALQLFQNALKHHAQVIKNLDESIPEINGNPGQLEQVIINLFKNASDAMESFNENLLMVSVTHEKAHVRMIIEDTGSGIPEDKLETIWEPFFTTKDSEKGLGLGLSVTKKIIEDHGGNIWAENRNEGGARFVIELPVNNIQGEQVVHA